MMTATYQTKTKAERITAMHTLELQLRLRGVQTRDPVRKALYDVAASSLRTTAIRAERVPEEQISRFLEDELLDLTLKLGKRATDDPRVAAEAGEIPMLISSRVCSDT